MGGGGKVHKLPPVHGVPGCIFGGLRDMQALIRLFMYLLLSQNQPYSRAGRDTGKTRGKRPQEMLAPKVAATLVSQAPAWLLKQAQGLCGTTPHLVPTR